MSQVKLEKMISRGIGKVGDETSRQNVVVEVTANEVRAQDE